MFLSKISQQTSHRCKSPTNTQVSPPTSSMGKVVNCMLSNARLNFHVKLNVDNQIKMEGVAITKFMNFLD